MFSVQLVITLLTADRPAGDGKHLEQSHLQLVYVNPRKTGAREIIEKHVLTMLTNVSSPPPTGVC